MLRGKYYGNGHRSNWDDMVYSSSFGRRCRESEKIIKMIYRHLIQKRIFQKRYGIYIVREKSLYLMMINVQKVILIQKKSDGQSLRNENQKKYLEKKYLDDET